MAENYDPGPASPGSSGFQTTHWSLVLQAGHGEPRRATEALEQLCQAYWYPLYAYVRRRGYNVEDAQDLTQGFLESLLRREDLATVAPEKGRFRTFLLTALSHYLTNEWRLGQRQKRGEGQPLISLDGLPTEERYRLEPATPETPELLYERRWAWTVMDLARQRLGAEYARAGKADLFRLLEPRLTAHPKETSHAQVAARVGTSPGAVAVALHRLRRRYGQIMRETIAETVAGPEEVDGEIRHLMAALSG